MKSNGFNIDPDDIVLVYCADCGEEYQVMAGEESCPCKFCGGHLEEL